MKNFVQRFLFAFGSAIILMFFSEYFFVNEAPVAELILATKENPFLVPFGFVEFALYYTLFTYPFLIILSKFRVRNLSILLLAGAIFGWMTEAIIVPVVYENIPSSFIFPSISWHAIIDVILGWYFVSMIMRRGGVIGIVIMFVALGAIWGAWATWFWFDAPIDMHLSANDFAIFAGVTTVFWVSGMWITNRFAMTAFLASKWEIGVVGIVALVLFAGMAWPYLPFSLLLLPLIGITIAALYVAGQKSSQSEILHSFQAKQPAKYAYFAVFLTPVSASLVYSWFSYTNAGVPTGLIIQILFLVGICWFCFALLHSFWPQRK